MTPHSHRSRVLPMVLYAGLALATSTDAFARPQTYPVVPGAHDAAPGGPDLFPGRYPAALRRTQTRGRAAQSAGDVAARTDLTRAQWLAPQARVGLRSMSAPQSRPREAQAQDG